MRLLRCARNDGWGTHDDTILGLVRMTKEQERVPWDRQWLLIKIFRG